MSWQVHAANRKAYHYTECDSDLVDAMLTIAGDDHTKHSLLGEGPADAKGQPIVFKDSPVAMGHVQVVRPNEGFPVLRIRVSPPKGLIYAPSGTCQTCY